jgi:hypothetical protein
VSKDTRQRANRIDATDWRESLSPSVPHDRRRRRFLPPTLIGVLGTLLLHTALIQTLPFGGQIPKAKPPESPQYENAYSKLTGRSEELVLLSLPIAINPNQAAFQLAISSLPDLRKMKIQAPITADLPETSELETLALSEDQSANLAPGTTGASEQARLFGIYTGQIQARIDRVWRRPRTPVNEDDPSASDSEAFQCEAQIVQDAKGSVQEILLPRCNGSPAWQRSLVAAIQHASPLPMPPSERVFRRSISFNFTGLPYITGAPDDEYERPRQSLTAIDSYRNNPQSTSAR